MKTFLFFFCIVSLTFAQPNPPTITPTNVTINYGQSITLTATGCNGIVTWADGQTGVNIMISPKQTTQISAKCAEFEQSSVVSSVSFIQVILETSSCDEQINLNVPILGVGYRYRASAKIVGTNLIGVYASVQFKAKKNIELNPGFEAKAGSVFKAFIRDCDENIELITRELINTNLRDPWEILWGPDDFIWMTERAGKISRVNPQTGEKIVIFTIEDVLMYGTGGLLGMVIHPNFTENPYIYVVYNYGNQNDMKEKVVRYTYDGYTLKEPITLIGNITGDYYHNGCRLVISPDLKLFITVSDASNINTSQDDNSLNGKILRINLDGSIPIDNPTIGSPVWSKGHRNCQGMVYANGNLYTSMHGADIEDEINVIQKSSNYGWPNIEGPCDTPTEITFCNENNIIPPIFSSGNTTLAFCGLDYYNNDAYPRWKNNLLMVSLKNKTFYSFKLSEDGKTIVGQPTQYFVSQFGRLRDIAISPSGKVYICTNNVASSDKIIEITPVVD